MNDKGKIKPLIEILLIVLLFLLFSYLTHKYIDNIKEYIGDSLSGMFVYVLLTVIAIVVAPISTMPLIPVAASMWGVFNSAVLSIMGWTVGAIIAFSLARKYGVSLIRKVVSLDNINAIEKRIPKGNFFWSVVFLRMSVPVDILSYALGLFSKIKTRDYVLATIIGITPFAFFFAYLGTLNILFQISFFTIGFIILVLGYLTKNTFNKNKEKNKKTENGAKHL